MRILAAMAVVISTLGLQAPSAPPAGTRRPTPSPGRSSGTTSISWPRTFLGGRRPDDPGYAIAAEYAASQFRAAGVRPAFKDAGGAPTYFQKVPMMKVVTTIDSPLTLSGAGGDKVIEALERLPADEPWPFSQPALRWSSSATASRSPITGGTTSRGWT